MTSCQRKEEITAADTPIVEQEHFQKPLPTLPNVYPANILSVNCANRDQTPPGLLVVEGKSSIWKRFSMICNPLDPLEQKRDQANQIKQLFEPLLQ
jgi:hypothetical protein